MSNFKLTIAELIANATAAGRALLTAADAAAQKVLLSLSKSDVGLGNVDNTSDANKPVSTAQAAAIAAKIGGSTGATDNRVLRADGTGGVNLQNSAVTIDDSGNVTGVQTVTLASTGQVQFGSSSVWMRWNSAGNNYIQASQAFQSESFISQGDFFLATNTGRLFVGVSNDLSWRRNATGPTWESRSAGGISVKDATGSGDAPVTCGALTASGAIGTTAINGGGFDGGIQLVFGGYGMVGFRSYSAGSTYPAAAGGGTGGSSLAGFQVASNASYNFGATTNAVVGSSDTTISRNAAGVVQIGTNARNSLGSLLCAGITASGDLICSTAGKGLQVKSGTGARAGTAVLVAGTVTVTNTTVTASTRIFLTVRTTGGTLGTLSYTLSAGASFTINSSSVSDTSTVTYFLIEVN